MANADKKRQARSIFQKHGGMFTIDEIAENIDKMLCTEPDITMRSGAYEKP